MGATINQTIFSFLSHSLRFLALLCVWQRYVVCRWHRRASYRHTHSYLYRRQGDDLMLWLIWPRACISCAFAFVWLVVSGEWLVSGA